jgi:putative RNA 2'-phosphotransferase
VNKTKASKFMSLVLRHDPSAADLTLDANGWARIDSLLAGMNAKGFAVTYDVLMEIVVEDEKRRYAVSDDGLSIRANQGHSIEVDVQLEQVRPPDVLFHGTGERSVDSIRRDGLRPMSRQHVHLSPDVPTATAVGNRHGRPFIFRVDAKAMADAGISFYRSGNGVWLVDHVPPQYLSEASGGL